MPSPIRCVSFPVVAAAVAFLHGCASPSSTPQACQSSAECSATARCVAGSCVSNAAPIADLALPAEALEATLLLTFDGSGSRDPDAASGDAIVSHAWAFRPVTAPCAPPAVAGTGPTAAVRFTCAGTYAVDLTVTDALGAVGTVTKELTVGDYTGPALVTVGPDVSLDHTCKPAPPCRPSGPVTLSAALTEAAPAGLELRWTVEPPPDRPLDANRRVGFDPGPDALSPAVTIETDGQAISGDWVFRFEGRDAAGVVLTGVTRVSVGNRPPAIVRTIPSVDHLFDGALFTTSGEIPFTVSDPDGDALVGPTVEWRHTGDGAGGLFFGSVLDAPARVSFGIAVPYSAPADALHLIGGDGLERSILFSIADVNDAPVSEVWPIAVGNRPPVLVSEPTGIVVPHTYDAVGLAYRAATSLSSWSDPDGDPLMPVPGASTGDPQCPQLDVVGGVGAVSCALAFTGTPAVGNFTGVHVVGQHVQDPWAAAAPSTVSFTVTNQAPTIDAAPTSLRATCSYGACCRTIPDPEPGSTGRICAAFRQYVSAASAPLTGRWLDADGDPIDVTLTGSPSQVCTPTACSLLVTSPAQNTCPLQDLPYEVILATTAADGDATASASITVTVDKYCL